MEPLRHINPISSKLPSDMVRYLKEVKNISPSHILEDGKTIEYHAYHLLKSNDIWDQVKAILEHVQIHEENPPKLQNEEISES